MKQLQSGKERGTKATQAQQVQMQSCDTGNGISKSGRCGNSYTREDAPHGAGVAFSLPNG
jgi:hypothetical protein